jgi:acetyl esterase/lipase
LTIDFGDPGRGCRVGAAVGTADLLSDSERLAAKAAEAGVDVARRIGEGLAPRLPDPGRYPEAAQATGQIGKFLRARVR